MELVSKIPGQRRAVGRSFVQLQEAEAMGLVPGRIEGCLREFRSGKGGRRFVDRADEG